MLFAGLAASAAVDLLSLLQPEKQSGKPGTRLAGQSAFDVAGLEADVQPLPAELRVPSAANRSEGLSRETLEQLLSAQGQQGAQRKKRSMSVLLDLLQSSQNGSVAKSDFEAAAGENDGDGSKIFDQIDQNRDQTVNVAELSVFLDSYRRTSEAGTSGKSRALAMVA
jgi:hypothetical protein